MSSNKGNLTLNKWGLRRIRAKVRPSIYRVKSSIHSSASNQSPKGCNSEIIGPGSTVWSAVAAVPSMTSCTQAPGIYCCSTKWSCCQTAFKTRTVFPIERAALHFSRGHQLRQRFSVKNMLVWVFSLKSCIYRTPFSTNTEGTSQKRGKKSVRAGGHRVCWNADPGHAVAACNHEVTAADHLKEIWARPSHSKFQREWGGADKTPPLARKLMMAREGRVIGLLGCSREWSMFTCIKAAVIGFNEQSRRRGDGDGSGKVGWEWDGLGVNWRSGQYRYSKYTACMYEILNKYILKYMFS